MVSAQAFLTSRFHSYLGLQLAVGHCPLSQSLSPGTEHPSLLSCPPFLETGGYEVQTMGLTILLGPPSLQGRASYSSTSLTDPPSAHRVLVVPVPHLTL